MPGKGALEGAGGLPAGELLSGGCLYLPEGLLSCQARSRCVRGDGMPAPCVCPSLSGPGAAESESGVKGGGGSPTTANFRPDTGLRSGSQARRHKAVVTVAMPPSIPPSNPPSPFPAGVWQWMHGRTDGCMNGWVGLFSQDFWDPRAAQLPRKWG